jgi:prevent-host-death family protein
VTNPTAGDGLAKASMEIQSIPATFLRLHTRDLLERVKYKGERFLVETFGRPMVVLISYDDYLSLQERVREQSKAFIPLTPSMSSCEPALQVTSTSIYQTEGVVPGGDSAPPSNGFSGRDSV